MACMMLGPGVVWSTNGLQAWLTESGIEATRVRGSGWFLAVGPKLPKWLFLYIGGFDRLLGVLLIGALLLGVYVKVPDCWCLHVWKCLLFDREDS